MCFSINFNFIYYKNQYIFWSWDDRKCCIFTVTESFLLRNSTLLWTLFLLLVCVACDDSTNSHHSEPNLILKHSSIFRSQKCIRSRKKNFLIWTMQVIFQRNLIDFYMSEPACHTIVIKGFLGNLNLISQVIFWTRLNQWFTKHLKWT